MRTIILILLFVFLLPLLPYGNNNIEMCWRIDLMEFYESEHGIPQTRIDFDYLFEVDFFGAC